MATSSCALFSAYLIKDIIKSGTMNNRFQAFLLARRKEVSVHVPTVTIMVKERFSNKASWKHFCSAEKKWPKKVVLGWNKTNMEE